MQWYWNDYGDSGSMRDYNIPYTMNCTNITIIAEELLGLVTEPYSVNMTSPGMLIPVETQTVCVKNS